LRPRNVRLDARLCRAFGAASLAGADEVGRGSLAGPLVVAAVRLAPKTVLVGVRDSKQLSRRQRERLSAEIRERALAYSVLFLPSSEVDRLNALQASLKGMRIVLRRVGAPAALVDGHLLPHGLAMPARALVRGDDRSQCVGAASILAKVSRDRYMRRMDSRFPGYGFARHVGYPTPEHLAALRALGPCALHRRSFAPVRAMLSQLPLNFSALPDPSRRDEHAPRPRG
jgi:ribonuclease HII